MIDVVFLIQNFKKQNVLNWIQFLFFLQKFKIKK